jgi:hypothetical protein
MVVLENGDRLPGSLDGRVALYERIPSPPAFLLRTDPTQATVERRPVGSA